MKRTKSRKTKRLKMAGWLLASLAVGLALIYLRVLVIRAADTDSEADTQPAASAPAGEEPTPGEPAAPSPAGPFRPGDSPDAVAQSMGGLLLMLGLACFGVTVICMGWFVWEFYQSRPAWKKQTKYPRRR